MIIDDQEDRKILQGVVSPKKPKFIHYSGNLLRNFTSRFLDAYLSDFWDGHKKYHKIKRKNFEGNSFRTISKMLEEKINKESFDDTLLENKLFEELAWVLPDSHHIYKFETEDTKEQMITTINTKTNSLNKPIYNRIKDDTELQITSLRVENDSVILLLRNGYTVNEDEKKTIFFIACEFNFIRKTFIIKMRESLRKNTKIPKRQILEEVFRYINKLTTDIALITKSEKAIKSNIYDIFTLETESAEAIITSHLPMSVKVLDQKIKGFILNDLNLNDITNLKPNCKTLKSMYYKNIAQNVPSQDFRNRYIFAFTFNDGNTTRSITRDKKRNHIYGKDLYWSLKSIVHKETKVDEISMYFKINNKDYKIPAVGDNFLAVEVTIKESHGSFMVDYYNKNWRDSERRFKSEFIIFELEKHL